MNDLLLDIRYAVRVLWKSPAFALVALITLMLGIGANIIVFGVVNSVLLTPLQVSNPSNLYELRIGAWTNWKLLTTSYPAYQDIRQRNTTLSDLAGFYGYCEGRLRWGNSIRSVFGYAVTGNYFDFLGVQPQLGRLIRAEDEHGPGSAPYIVLSDNLWRSAFNSDPAIVGRSVRLYNESFTVIGVAPPQFHGTERFVWPEFYIPIVNYFGQGYLQDRTGRPLAVLGRVKPGITPKQASENLSAISAQLGREFPQTDTGLPRRLVRPGLYGDTGDVIRGALYSVTALTLLVLLAVCANLASLFAARAADRSRELAVRVAVGATRWRIARQLLIEALVVSAAGGAIGLTTASLLLHPGGGRSLPSFLGNSGNYHLAANVDSRVYLVAVVLTLLSALLFGMIPARGAWSISPLQAMKNGPVDARASRGLTLRDLLLGSQIAICMVMVIASLVAVRGMTQMLNAPLGFQPQGALLADVDARDVEPGEEIPLTKEKTMIDALRSLPGVTAVGTLDHPFFSGGRRGIPVFPPGTTDFALKNSILAPLSFTISPGFLEAAHTGLRAGRDFSWDDTRETPFVVVVNETFVKKMWGNVSAIGKRFIFLDHLREVVGVVEDGKYLEIQEPSQPVVYLPLTQSEDTYANFVVRSYRSKREMIPDIERTLKRFEPDAAITVQSWSDALEGALFPARAAAQALGVIGLLAAMLAVTGIFGTAAYNVSRRMKELGIRIALGARMNHVLHAAVGRPMVLLGIGSLLGLLLASLAGRLLSQIVYQANPRDPMVVTGAVLIMALLGVAASAIPALRALAVDPSKLMREE